MNTVVKNNSSLDQNYVLNPLDENKLNAHIESLKERFPEFKDKSKEEMLTILRDNENRNDYETTSPYRLSLDELTTVSKQEIDQENVGGYEKKKIARAKRMKERKTAKGLDTECRMKEKLEKSWDLPSFEHLAVAMDFTQQALDKWTTPAHIEKLIDSKIHLNDLQGHLSHIYNKPISPWMIQHIQELVFSGKALLRDLMVGKLDGEYGPESINFLWTRKYELNLGTATTKVNRLLNSNYVDKKTLELTDEKLKASLTSGMMQHYGVSKEFIEDGLTLYIDPSEKFDYFSTFLQIIRRIAENTLKHDTTIPEENKDWIKSSLETIPEKWVEIYKEKTEGTEKLIAYSVIVDVLRTRLDDSGTAVRDWNNLDNFIPEINSSTQLWHQEMLDAQENFMKLLQHNFSTVRPWIGIDYTETEKWNHISYHGKYGKVEITSHLNFSIPADWWKRKPLTMLIYFDPDKQDFFLNKAWVSCPAGVDYNVNIDLLEDNKLRDIPLSKITQAQIQQYADCFTLREKK